MYPEIPRTVADIDCTWLTDALQATGILSAKSKVKQINVTPMGPGVAGKVHRLHLKYTQNEGPPTVVAKLHSCESFSLRRFPLKLSTEAGFYKDIGVTCGINVPRCFYVAYEPEKEAFCLIMEDVGIGRSTVSSYTRLTEPEWRCLFSEVAHLHAKWWESPKLHSLPWLRTFEDEVKQRLALMPTILADFLPRWSSRLAPEYVDLFKRLPSLFRTAMNNLRASQSTLLHTDLNPGNLIFKEKDSQLIMYVIDWQDVVSGPIARDLALTLSYIEPESRSKALELYTKVLLKQTGVDYSEDRLAVEVLACSLFGAFVASGRGALGTEEQDAVCLRMINNRGANWLEAAKLFG